MSDHIDRMNTEIAELDDKRMKLSKFIEGGGFFEKLEPEDQELMRRQLVHMTEYSQILALRVERAISVS